MQKQKALNYILSGVVLYLTVVACGDSSNTDTSKPVITMTGSSPVEAKQNVTYNDAGATANDAKYGDISANIVTVNSVDDSTIGTYTVTYDVTNSDQQAADQVVRTVNVVANATPVITLLGISPVDVVLGNTYVDDGAAAADTEDGDITASIVTVNSVDDSTIGTYTVTYDVTDSDQQAADQVVRTVNVVANATPVITLQGISPVDVALGSTYVDDGATAADTEDGDITATIVTVNPVDTGLVGTYTVTYDVIDSAGAAATQVTRTVNVVSGGATDGPA